MVTAYHGVAAEDLDSVLAEGLLLSKTDWAREGLYWHLSFAETPGIAAAYGIVVAADLSGLDLPEEGFVGSELRLHENVSPERLSVLDPQPPIDERGFDDPRYYEGGNHPTCRRLRCWEHPPEGLRSAR
jgi:hypothetical protein